MSYHPTLGRFIQRDPLGYVDGGSLYEYVAGAPLLRGDPMGLRWRHRGEEVPSVLGDPVLDLQDPAYWAWYQLTTGTVTERDRQAQSFMSWYLHERGSMRWLDQLPQCPCSIPLNSDGESCGNPDPAVWDDPRKPFRGDYFHPGAVWELRRNEATSTASGGSGQQCTYDKNGNLITHGRGAGTPDRTSPSVNGGIPDYILPIFPDPNSHKAQDVAPFDLAVALGDEYVAMYLEVRPPNNGLNCAKNP